MATSRAPLPELDFEAMSAEDVLRWAYERVRRPALPDLLVAEAVVGARAHGLRARPRHRRRRARHAALLPGELRDARPARRALRPRAASAAAGDHRRRAAPARGPEPLGDRPRPLLPHPQGRAAAASALEPYDAWISGHPPRPVAEPRDHAEGQWSERYGVWKLHPLADWDEKRVWAYIHVNEIPVQPAARRRATARSAASRARGPIAPERGGARRPLGRLRQARVRHPRRNATRRHMTEHIYAARAPRVRRTSAPAASRSGSPGSPGSGKTTIAHLVGPELDRRGLVVEYLDGDTVRTHLSKGLGFSKEDRDTNIERIGWVASRLTRQGGAVIAAAISPYEETRQKARELVEEVGTFVEVYVKASVDECAQRDVKGLYEKAFAGEIKEFTGVSDPYEEPASPELVVDTEEHEPEESGGARRRQARGARPRPGAGDGVSVADDDAADRAARRQARRPHRRRGPTASRRSSSVDADLARALRPRHARVRRALAARGLHGPARLRARRRGHAARERPALGAARLPRGRPRRRTGDRVALDRRGGHAARRARRRGGLRVRQGARGRALLPHDRRRAPRRGAALRAEAALPRRPRDRLRAGRARRSRSSRSTRPRRARRSPSAAGSASSASRRATRSTARTST